MNERVTVPLDQLIHVLPSSPHRRMEWRCRLCSDYGRSDTRESAHSQAVEHYAARHGA